MARVPAFGLVPHRDGQVLPREALRLDDQLQPQNAGFHGPPSLLQWTSLKSFLPATQSEQALGAPAFSPVLPKDHTHQGCPPTCHSQLVTEPSQSPLATPAATAVSTSRLGLCLWPPPPRALPTSPSSSAHRLCPCSSCTGPWPGAPQPGAAAHRPCFPGSRWLLSSENRHGLLTPPTRGLAQTAPCSDLHHTGSKPASCGLGAWGTKTARSRPRELPPWREGHADKRQLRRGKCQARGGWTVTGLRRQEAEQPAGGTPGGTPPHIRLKGRAWPAHTAIPASAKDTHCPSLGRRDPSTRASSGGPPTAGAQTRHLASVLALPHRWGRKQGNLGGLPGGSSGITHARRCAGPGTPSTLPRAALPAAAADVTVRLLPATARADGLSTPASRTRAPVPHSAPGLRACGRQASRQECPSLRPTLPPKPSQRPLGEAAPGPHALFCVPPSRPARRPRTGPESSDRGHRGSGGGCKRTVRSPRRESHPAADQGGQSPPHARAAGGRATPGLSHLPGPRRRASDRVLP